MVAVWPAIHTERSALLADLEPLTDQQWAARSLCTQPSSTVLVSRVMEIGL